MRRSENPGLHFGPKGFVSFHAACFILQPDEAHNFPKQTIPDGPIVSVMRYKHMGLSLPAHRHGLGTISFLAFNLPTMVSPLLACLVLPRRDMCLTVCFFGQKGVWSRMITCWHRWCRHHRGRFSSLGIILRPGLGAMKYGGDKAKLIKVGKHGNILGVFVPPRCIRHSDFWVARDDGLLGLDYKMTHDYKVVIMNFGTHTWTPNPCGLVAFSGHGHEDFGAIPPRG